MRNSQPSGLASAPARGRASSALTSASWTTSSPSMTDPVMRAQYRWSFGLSARRAARGSRPWSLQDNQDGSSFGLAVQRGDPSVALEAVGDTGRVAPIGQKRCHLLTVLPGRERGAVPFGQERLDREATASSPGAGGLVTDRGLGHDLLWDQHLKVN